MNSNPLDPPPPPLQPSPQTTPEALASPNPSLNPPPNPFASLFQNPLFPNPLFPNPLLSNPDSSDPSPQQIAHAGTRRRNARPRAGTPHLPLAMGTWLSLPSVWPSLSADWTNASSSPAQNVATLLKNWFAPFAAKLPQPLSAEDATKLQEAVSAAAYERTSGFIKGLRAYHDHDALRGAGDGFEPCEIWREGTSALLDYAPGAAAEAPLVFVVPSLINRFDILDLAPDHSFLRSLAKAGFHPIVIDWDAPGELEKDFTLTDYMEKRLIPALRFLVEGPSKGQGAGKPCLLLGYCMGGLLTLAASVMEPALVRGLILMATPWDMTPGGDAARAMLAVAEQVEPWLAKLGYLPVPILQALFTGFQPGHALKKYLRFADLDPASLEARLFVLTEDWLNDGVPLTAPVARECLRDWYGENRPGRGVWKIGEKIIDPHDVTMPTYVLVPGLDKIVAPESARPLAQMIPQATLAEPMLGHIGLLSSRRAPEHVWGPLIEWMHAVKVG